MQCMLYLPPLIIHYRSIGERMNADAMYAILVTPDYSLPIDRGADECRCNAMLYLPALIIHY